MNTTPNANRKHIAIYGKTNSGKSSLLNAIIGQDVSLVSSISGTTTDPVTKAMELIPLGPVLFIDTAGLDDNSDLGDLRIKRTLKALDSTDFAIYVIDINDIVKFIKLGSNRYNNSDNVRKSYSDADYLNMIKSFKSHSISHLIVINKIDTIGEEELNAVKALFTSAVFTSNKIPNSILNLKDKLIEKIQDEEKEETILGDLLPPNSKVIMVVPVDSEAPKGRLILPQVQLIRDCLDNGIKSYVVRDTELQSALNDIKDIDLVVTDSQAFKMVSALVPPNIKLTSFSILFARLKGDIDTFIKGVKTVDSLTESSKILISESCTHNYSHEDIGRVKIPKLLNNYLGKELNYEFKMGNDFPQNLSDYDLVIHCGSCMLNKKTMETRIDYCLENNVSITNYGIILAYLTGILQRSTEIFNI